MFKPGLLYNRVYFQSQIFFQPLPTPYRPFEGLHVSRFDKGFTERRPLLPLGLCLPTRSHRQNPFLWTARTAVQKLTFLLKLGVFFYFCVCLSLILLNCNNNNSVIHSFVLKKKTHTWRRSCCVCEESLFIIKVLWGQWTCSKYPPPLILISPSGSMPFPHFLILPNEAGLQYLTCIHGLYFSLLCISWIGL